MKSHKQKNGTVWEWEESKEIKELIKKQEEGKTNEKSK